MVIVSVDACDPVVVEVDTKLGVPVVNVVVVLHSIWFGTV